MTKETGLTRRPEKYLPAPISKEQAMYLLKTIWPKAPETEVIKAGILCQQYGLNPLMRQVYLIQFGQEWVTVLGIKATRQIAQQALAKRGIRYSYQDGPRVMSEKEQVKIRGKIEADKIWAITILADNFSNNYPGYGFWPATKQPYGVDKGNDALNMAFIRSERNALDKLAPGELPDIEVADDTYIQGDYKIAIEKGKQGFLQQVEKDIDDLWGEKPAEKQPEPTTSTPDTLEKTGIEEESSGISQEGQEEAPETSNDFGQWMIANLPLAKWKQAQVISWMRSKENYRGLIFAPTFAGTMKKLSQEQADFLKSEVLKRIELA